MTVKDLTTLKNDVQAALPDNTVQAISASDVRSSVVDSIDSLEEFRKFTRETGITASTTQTQAGALPLTKEVSIVTVVANADDAVKLLGAGGGIMQKVVNQGANRLQVFPGSGDAIDGGAVDASVTIAPGASATFHAVDNDNWYS